MYFNSDKTWDSSRCPREKRAAYLSREHELCHTEARVVSGIFVIEKP